MYDYDAQYRRLKEAGFPGWAGHAYDRGVARLAASLARLDRSGILPGPPARTLELGCGTGTASALLAPRGYAVHGIDISATAIAWARERFTASALAGSFRQGSVCAMPCFGNSSFDLVFDGNCLHCLIGDDRPRALAEVKRILRPQGLFIVSSMCGLPRSDEAKARFDPHNGRLLEGGEPYRTLKPVEQLAQELNQAGFEIEDTRTQVNPWWDHVTMACRHLAGANTVNPVASACQSMIV